jgi:hypothetical protein
MAISGCWLNKGGYKGRYPETWKEKLDLIMKKKLCPITGIIDHAVRVCIDSVAGTVHAENFVIFYDELSAWWDRLFRT